MSPYLDYTHVPGKNLLYLQPNANSVNTSVTQQLMETSASATTVVPSVANKNLNVSEMNHS
jgi:hypothetical protein